MNARPILIAAGLTLLQAPAWGDAGLQAPASVAAGTAFSIPTTGIGKAVLYVTGPGGALRKDIELGSPISIAAGELFNAGRYLLVLTAGSSTQTALLEVGPSTRAETISFLARPSRLPVGVRGGITGTAYLFDAYRNLMTASTPIAFQLSTPSSPVQTRTTPTRNGVAWTSMDSTPRQGRARFTAQAGSVSVLRIIDEVPGDPCSLNMSAHPNGGRVTLETAPVRDCSGNPVPDGTVVTFTESANGAQSTVDAPLKQGIARAAMPLVPGARVSVASGVVAGNEIRLGGSR